MERSAHPLTVELIDRLRHRPNVHVLEIGTGSGRNTAALLAAGLFVTSVDDDHERTAAARERFAGEPVRLVTSAYTQIAGHAQSFTAAISTHGLLHGSAHKIATILFNVNRLLEKGGLFYATFGSKSDARFGKGVQIDEDTFAPSAGAEQGVPHVYYDEVQLRAALAPSFEVESLDEVGVDTVVGRWAHARQPEGSAHWFLRATRLHSAKS